MGNTAMHHLFSGLCVEPLAAVPFRSPAIGEQQFDAAELEWPLELRHPACVSCLRRRLRGQRPAGRSGGDRPASKAPSPGALLDLGTNGEIAVGNRERIRCASTAAGPAFEGGRIGMGMRAGGGAIDKVSIVDGALDCSVIGGGSAARPLRQRPGGRRGRGPRPGLGRAQRPDDAGPRSRSHFPVPWRSPRPTFASCNWPRALWQPGSTCSWTERRLAPSRVYLAGAFGNYIRGASARRIGLLPAWVDHPTSGGNTALRGARMLLLAPSHREQILSHVLACTEHVELAANPRFQDAFVECMRFPG